MIDNNTKYLVALAHFPKFGPARLKKIKRYFTCLEKAFRASAKNLTAAGLEENIANEFAAARDSIEPDKILEIMEKENIRALTVDDESYPRLLAEIYDPPQLLFCKGKIGGRNKPSLAVVGTRKYTHYGRQAAENIVNDLAANNFTIVSGLAYGIDSIAHNATLSAGGRTIAVLGSGIDKYSIYPSANRYLADKIIDGGGLIMSEFPLGAPPLKHHFPQRNRIISGLSAGTLVIEAAEKSGSLITANLALEQNREVFAVPGNIFSSVSRGPNNLIKQGARAVTSAQDIIETLDLAHISEHISAEKNIPASKEEALILDNLSHEPRHIDQIARLTKLDISITSSTLVIMEMKGAVKNIGNMEYILTK